MEMRALFPDLAAAYETMGAAARAAGPLDAKTAELIKLALAIGIQSEGAVHSHARRAAELGADLSEIYQVVALSVGTLGWPRANAAFTWIKDVVKRPSRRRLRLPKAEGPAEPSPPSVG